MFYSILFYGQMLHKMTEYVTFRIMRAGCQSQTVLLVDIAFHESNMD